MFAHIDEHVCHHSGQCSPCNVKMWIRVPESVWARGLC